MYMITKGLSTRITFKVFDSETDSVKRMSVKSLTFFAFECRRRFQLKTNLSRLQFGEFMSDFKRTLKQ